MRIIIKRKTFFIIFTLFIFNKCFWKHAFSLRHIFSNIRNQYISSVHASRKMKMKTYKFLKSAQLIYLELSSQKQTLSMTEFQANNTRENKRLINLAD